MKLEGRYKSLNLQKYKRKDFKHIAHTFSNYLVINSKPLTVNSLKVVFFL